MIFLEPIEIELCTRALRTLKRSLSEAIEANTDAAKCIRLAVDVEVERLEKLIGYLEKKAEDD